MASLQGECLCGQVTYKYEGEIGAVLNCHCTECRRWHGAAYRTRTVGRKSDFVWLKGENLVTRYDGQPNSIKTFCRVCGSSLISLYKEKSELIGLPLGGVTFDAESDAESDAEMKSLKPVCHIFVGSKSSWHDISDDLPQYKTLPADPDLHKL